MGRHDVECVPGFQLVTDPVRKDTASNTLDRYHPVELVRSSAERVVTPYFLAPDRCPQCQMLAGAKRKAVPKLWGNIEADRIGFAGLGNDLRDAKGVEMLGHGVRLDYHFASG